MSIAKNYLSASKLDAFLQFNDAEVLQNKGKVTAAIAKAFSESEFEQYRVLQSVCIKATLTVLLQALRKITDGMRTLKFLFNI